MSLSDNRIVPRAGRAFQCAGSPDVYRRPADVIVATFAGSPRMTVWRGRREDDVLACRGGWPRRRIRRFEAASGRRLEPAGAAP